MRVSGLGFGLEGILPRVWNLPGENRAPPNSAFEDKEAEGTLKPGLGFLAS